MKIVGYTDRFSVQPGERVRFMVSCEDPTYRADVVRLIHGDPNPKGPGFKEEPLETAVSGEYPGRVQRLHPGSYVIVPDDPALRLSGGFTIQAWIYPTIPTKGAQGIITKWSADDKGYGLFIGEDGCVELRIGGDGGVDRLSSGRPLRASTWYFVAGTYDPEGGVVRLHQEPISDWPLEESSAIVERATQVRSVAKSEAPLLMAAYWQRHDSGGEVVGGHYDGKIDRLGIFGRALRPNEITSLNRGASPRAFGPDLVGSWDFAADISFTRVTDTSPHGLHGRTVNLPTRAMTGYNWTGNETNFNLARDEYGAIHFHDDDLEDAGWEVDFELIVPPGTRSGVYAARLKSGGDEDYIPFFVRPARGSANTKIGFLAPTNSYIAYANEHMAGHPRIQEFIAGQIDYPTQVQDKYIVEQRLAGMYDHHPDRSGVCYSSRLRPIANMRPKYNMPLLANGQGSPHQFNADLHLLDWMEATRHGYDLFTDEDVHIEGAGLLAPYDVIVTGSHPEYWSQQMMDALEAYLAGGGRLMYLGGNGFYWVTSYHPELPHVIEIRRWRGTGTWQAEPGEYFHSTTGELGGLWRFRGRPPQKILGIGFTAEGLDRNAPYRRQPGSFDPRAAFIFEGIGDEELIGDFDSLVMEHGAAGFELDRLDFALGTPPTPCCWRPPSAIQTPTSTSWRRC